LSFNLRRAAGLAVALGIANMANKLDKEALIKHRFWIGLGLFGAIWIVGIIVVKVSGDETKKKAWEDAKKEIEGTKSKGVKTEKWQDPWNAFGVVFSKQKDKIWKAAWEQQALMYDWPDKMAKPVYYPDDRFGSDDRSDVVNRDYYRTVLYPAQWQDVKDHNGWVAPVEFYGGFDKVFPSQVWDLERSPTREEIWLAQEDYWVRREMLYIVATALENIVRFQEEKVDEKKEKLPDGVVKHLRFRNANFELNLLLTKAPRGPGWVIGPESTIKNISVTRRTLPLATPDSNDGLLFILYQSGASFPMYIAGEPLAYDREVQIKKTFSTDTVDLKKPFGVQQGLVWKNSPIRRIDELRLAYHSHRTITSGLKAREDLKALDPEPKEDAPAPTGGSGGAGGDGRPSMGSGNMGGMASGMGGMGGRGSEADATRVNKIPRDRYMHVTPQCRHLPIAMRLVLDQAHTHDFLAAVANSRLRIQITQVTFSNISKRVERFAPAGDSGAGKGPGGSGPSTPGGKPGVGSGSGAGGPGYGSGSSPPSGMGSGMGSGGVGPGAYGGGASGGGQRPGNSGDGRRPGGGRGGSGGFGGPGRPGGPGGPGRPGGSSDPSQAQTPDPASLVELTVYGVASLYERFPPKAAQPASTPASPPTPPPAKK
jgi:hypothetical protein